MHKNKCKLNDKLCERTIQTKQLECLKYAHENGCKLNEKDFLKVFYAKDEHPCSEYILNALEIQKKYLEKVSDNSKHKELDWLMHHMEIYDTDSTNIKSHYLNRRDNAPPFNMHHLPPGYALDMSILISYCKTIVNKHDMTIDLDEFKNKKLIEDRIIYLKFMNKLE